MDASWSWSWGKERKEKKVKRKFFLQLFLFLCRQFLIWNLVCWIKWFEWVRNRWVCVDSLQVRNTNYNWLTVDRISSLKQIVCLKGEILTFWLASYLQYWKGKKRLYFSRPSALSFSFERLFSGSTHIRTGQTLFSTFNHITWSMSKNILILTWIRKKRVLSKIENYPSPVDK